MRFHASLLFYSIILKNDNIPDEASRRSGISLSELKDSGSMAGMVDLKEVTNFAIFCKNDVSSLNSFHEKDHRCFCAGFNCAGVL